ncbi:hypothetical protein Z043_123799 [Scleropages formosus]|uniref:Proteasome activator PA28 C-terminal domain-containing protein n=1 Tax=Scleropages formosus TaxID=113540 RepID=A0A0P7WBB2_SCLFO|nr:hypothetical protein Z043_123799 [Scleropages formosus]
MEYPLFSNVKISPLTSKEMETDKNEEDEKKKKKAPKCGYIGGNEKMMKLLNRVKPEIRDLKETCILVSFLALHPICPLPCVACWIQHLIPKIEDGNDFGVAIQMDYRSLVHEKDEAAYSEIRVVVLDIRGFYAELYDIISKNQDKVTNPKGEEKPSMY